MKKTIAFLVFLTATTYMAFASDLYCGVSAMGQGALNDTAHAVVAQADIAAKMSLGGFLDYRNGLYGDASFAYRIADKQYSRFTDVPSYEQFALGFGWIYKGDVLLMSIDAGLAMARIGKSWEAGVYLDVHPRFLAAEFDAVGRIAVGLPFQFVFTGMTYRHSIGLSVGWEIYR